MSLDYLYVLNAVLRDTNEVPLTATNFHTARGFHAFLKEATNRALMDLVNESTEWPWLANVPLDVDISAHSNEIETARRQAIYSFPEGVMDVDWDSIVLTDMRGKETTPLTPISYEEWARKGHADVLSNRTKEDIGTPRVIYKTKDGQGFGLSPVPDKAYRVQYISWHSPALLRDPTDKLPFADRFYNVLVSRTRYYAWMFRENVQQAQMARADYDDGVSNMKIALIKPISLVMRAT